jgi:hypothetical protein
MKNQMSKGKKQSAEIAEWRSERISNIEQGILNSEVLRQRAGGFNRFLHFACTGLRSE